MSCRPIKRRVVHVLRPMSAGLSAPVLFVNTALATDYGPSLWTKCPAYDFKKAELTEGATIHLAVSGSARFPFDGHLRRAAKNDKMDPAPKICRLMR